MNTPLDTISNQINNTSVKEKVVLSQAEVDALLLARVNSVKYSQTNKTKLASADNANSANNHNPMIGNTDGCLESGSQMEWGPVLPFREVSPGRPYPIDALPPIIRGAVEEVSRFIQAPVALAANSALACLATACQGHFNVCRDSKLIGPTSLFFLTIAESGERKTSCDNFFSNELEATEMRLQQGKAEEVSQYISNKATWTRKVEGIDRGIEKLSAEIHKTEKEKLIKELESKRAELRKEEPIAPKVPIILRTDDTPENLRHALMFEWPSAGIISSEGGMVLSSRALNKESINGTLSMYDHIWDGKPWKIGRVTSKSFKVSGVRLSMGLQVQTGVFDQFFGANENIARNVGFIARCLFSYPCSTQGQRLYKAAPDKMLMLDAFNQKVRSLLELEHTFVNGVLTLKNIPLNKDAHKIWAEFHDQCETELRKGGKYESIKDVTSKIAENAARIAALFAASNGLPILEVDANSMERGCKLALWHLDEANRCFGKASASELSAVGNARKLECWLIKQLSENNHENLHTSKILNKGPECVRERKHLDAAIKILTEKNRARLAADCGYLEVNPDLVT